MSSTKFSRSPNGLEVLEIEIGSLKSGVWFFQAAFLPRRIGVGVLGDDW